VPDTKRFNLTANPHRGFTNFLKFETDAWGTGVFNHTHLLAPIYAAIFRVRGDIKKHVTIANEERRLH